MNEQRVTLADTNPLATNLAAGDNVILRLPSGVNFVGTPQAIVIRRRRTKTKTLALGDRAGEPAEVALVVS